MRREALPAIVHEATVVSSDTARGIVTVRVLHSGSADCSGCAAAMLCRRKGDDILEIRSAGPSAFRPGDRVRIGASAPAHRKAVMLLLVYPCLIAVGALAVVKACGLPDGVAAATCLGAASLVYLTLYLLRRRLRMAVEFEIL